jgi:hypothetical protein
MGIHGRRVLQRGGTYFVSIILVAFREQTRGSKVAAGRSLRNCCSDPGEIVVAGTRLGARQAGKYQVLNVHEGRLRGFLCHWM